MEIFGMFLSAVIIVIGWFVNGYYSSKRDQQNHLRNLEMAQKNHLQNVKTEYLIETYKKMAYSSNRKVDKEQYWETMEEYIDDIQLLGSKEQIDLINRYIGEMQENGRPSFDDLLNNLRNELRSELELEPLSNNRRWLRFKTEKSDTDQEA